LPGKIKTSLFSAVRKNEMDALMMVITAHAIYERTNHKEYDKKERLYRAIFTVCR
jgi:hypothetical protein